MILDMDGHIYKKGDRIILRVIYYVMYAVAIAIIPFFVIGMAFKMMLKKGNRRI